MKEEGWGRKKWDEKGGRRRKKRERRKHTFTSGALRLFQAAWYYGRRVSIVMLFTIARTIARAIARTIAVDNIR